MPTDRLRELVAMGHTLDSLVQRAQQPGVRAVPLGITMSYEPPGLTGVMTANKMTPMVKTQVYLRAEELDALHSVAERSGRSVADLIREAIRRVWLRPEAQGPVALWDGTPSHTSVEHDRIYDER